MFHSFFPNPKPFFLSFLAWCAIVVVFWYFGGAQLGATFGMAPLPEDAEPIIGLGYFWTPDVLWFYLYFAACVALFGGFWIWYSRHPWAPWSIFGTAFILFTTYFSVQTSVAINNWRRPMYDLIQAALTKPDSVAGADLFALMLVFFQIASMWILVAVLIRFVVSHYIFRWRTAMNNYYTAHWKRLRHIEGASQRVQEDTMRFAETMESLGVNAIDSVMTLIAFLPILLSLSQYVTELPLVGEIPAPLVQAAVFWSLFGTVLLSVVGIKLPGLYFKNQRVEAAFRKELVYGEDDHARAEPPTLIELFSHVRRNYFRLYFHYMYFNVARYFYIQTDVIFPMVILVPTIAAGRITFGIFQQILSAFSQVSNSFQYLVNSWSTIVELLSIHKRLQAFEAAIADQPLPQIDQEYLAKGSARPNPAE